MEVFGYFLRGLLDFFSECLFEGVVLLLYLREDFFLDLLGDDLFVVGLRLDGDG